MKKAYHPELTKTVVPVHVASVSIVLPVSWTSWRKSNANLDLALTSDLDKWETHSARPSNQRPQNRDG
jgi:hypothetical protein